MPKGKRPTVDLKMRGEWFRLVEEESYTPPQIARRYGYDARTVRHYLQTEADERQRKQATLMVLKDALQAHFLDLARLAEAIDAQVKEARPFTVTSENSPLVTALREHTRRISLWGKIEKWNAHLQKTVDLESDVRARIKKRVEADHEVRGLAAGDDRLILESLPRVLASQVASWARGEKGLSVDEHFIIEPAADDLVSPRYGAFWFGQMSRASSEELKRAIRKYETRIKRWKDVDRMKTLLVKREKLTAELGEDLGYIIHRRVVSGRCRYCPW